MKQGVVRIIGGQWRGRKLMVPAISGVRPTPDRVRETLFNWLSSKVGHSRCLDVFAGTGALGFEAASRGAALVEMVDQSKAIVTLLQEEALAFNATMLHIYQAQAPKALKQPKQPFDIIFLDPPYQSPLLLPTCFYLEEHGFVSDDAFIYLEADHAITESELPCHWRLVKSERAGQVFYHLAQREKA